MAGREKDDSRLEVRPFEGPAAGIGAVLKTVEHADRQTGLIRGTQLLLRVNQQEGFDCPGCAWPDPADRATAEFCENGAKAVAHEGTTRRVRPHFFKQYSISRLDEESDRWLEQQGRLTHPMIRRPGRDHYEQISWNEAFVLIAGELRELESPDQAIFYTSGRTSNEAAFLYQLFVRSFGTNNLPDCSNMCHESSGKGLGKVIGVGKGTVGLDDFPRADAIFVIGQNPGTNHPRMLTALEQAKEQGAKIVSINPLRERGLERFAHPQTVKGVLGEGTALSDHYLQVKINGDVALLKGIMKDVLGAERANPGTVIDKRFIEDYTQGFEALVEDLDRTEWSEILQKTGLSRDAIWYAAKIYIESRATIACWAMGLTQHKNGVANIREVVNLLLLKGNIGRPGAGACPVRGHSNVQGDRTMGIWERPTPAFLDNLERGVGSGFKAPREHGLDTVEAISEMAAGRIGVFFALGGNFVSASPDTERTAEALSRCKLTVQVSTKLNRSHLKTGQTALILPCLGRTERDVQNGREQFVTVENSMRVVHRSRGRMAPASDKLLSEPRIVTSLAAETLGASTPVDWDWLVKDYDRIRDLIERCVPGFDAYNQRVREPNGFILPCPAHQRKFLTESGRAEFTVQAIPDIPLGPGQLLMMTIRSHDQYNTTVYTDDDRYRGIYGHRRVVLMNAEDIDALGLEARQHVDLCSHFQGTRRWAEDFVVVPYDIPRQCAATYFPEANPLVPLESFADESHTPTSKSVVISVEPR